jgi:hypothetical protein
MKNYRRSVHYFSGNIFNAQLLWLKRRQVAYLIKTAGANSECRDFNETIPFCQFPRGKWKNILHTNQAPEHCLTDEIVLL